MSKGIIQQKLSRSILYKNDLGTQKILTEYPTDKYIF